MCPALAAAAAAAAAAGCDWATGTLEVVEGFGASVLAGVPAVGAAAVLRGGSVVVEAVASGGAKGVALDEAAVLLPNQGEAAAP